MVELTRYHWNVVVVGFWNRAILTPSGIARYVLELESERGFTVRVPASFGIGSPQVCFEDVIISLEGTSLIVQAQKEEWPTLEKAMAYASAAITNLPETPFSAAGFNVRFRADEQSELLLQHTATQLDEALPLGGFTISDRSLARTIQFGDGVIRLQVGTDAEHTDVSLNFHRQSGNRDELVAWLDTPIEAIKEKTRGILKLFELEED